MVSFVLEELKEVLVHSSLYSTATNVQYGVSQSNYHFYTMLECYNSETCTFFTTVGKTGFALHEMYEVSNLATGDINIHMKSTFPV